jgi:hypothetical protein
MKDKYYFLLYLPIVYFIPPLHETFHVLIAWAFGVGVKRIEWNIVYPTSIGSPAYRFFQFQVWDGYWMMMFICVSCITLFIAFFLKAHHVIVNWEKIRKDLESLRWRTSG